jgi:starch phosphorylase
VSEVAERFLHTRVARSVDAIQRSFVDNLFYVTGRTFKDATPLDLYTALAYTVRDRLLARFVAARERYAAIEHQEDGVWQWQSKIRA